MHRRVFFHVRYAIWIDWLLLSSLARAAWDCVPAECGHIGR